MTEYIKQKRILLRDTRGNYSLGIKLPTKDYKPKNQAVKKTEQEKRRMVWREGSRKWRQTHLRQHATYQRTWSKRNPDKVKAIMKRHYAKKRKQLVYLRNNERNTIKRVRKNA